ncbi:accessory gene regulator B family protein [Senegalia massiliensis]|uniref:Accessory regulator AgrB n=1 Tax=Senegalia massiliensis TaxID=1720316 RepID=A0A845QUK3_9CLOT|nr:accessory gene regulator B family protein [Senegalia massiliensis]NBI05479.1 accessory regulator AgrB [Senegalia massiliensis]
MKIENSINSPDRLILKRIILMIVNIITIIVIGILFDRVLESIIFIISYEPIRSYAGGYDAGNNLNCYIFSLAVTIIAMISIKYIPSSNYIILFLVIISSFIVLLSPVEDINNFSNKEKAKKYKIISKMMCILELAIVLMLLILKVNNIALTISISLFILSIMILFGKVQ